MRINPMVGCTYKKMRQLWFGTAQCMKKIGEMLQLYAYVDRFYPKVYSELATKQTVLAAKQFHV